ncbi:MAG: cupin domain-containing protein [Erysipelotrichaceae bacterium]|nr:cupin domain-containing protein [Erysipelotrichaceae bacterium]
MIRKNIECKQSVKVAMRDGDGQVELTELATKEELMEKGRLFSILTFKKDCGIGIHDHVGEQEYFYVISGKGHYTDDGVESIIEKGDVTICFDGHSHGIVNREEEDLVVLASILLK